MKNIQQTIQSLLDRLVEEGAERGLQVAVYRGGELVVDASAGIADPSTDRPVNGDTLFPIFSTTKGIAATLIHLLVERGKIAYDTRIADVWPEFAAHGKGEITLRHALNHTAGIPNMPAGIGHAELCDWDTMCAAIADLTPVSPPGGQRVYHAVTYSWTLGEVARRVDGRPFPQQLREEICAPLDILDEMFVGIPDEVEDRVAILEAEPEEAADSPPHSDAPQPISALIQPLHEWMNRPDARRACLPASTGIMTARAIARHYAALLPGGVDRVELLPPERVRLATELQPPVEDRPHIHSARQALGYQIGGLFSTNCFGHAGYGGSIGFADLEGNVAVAFARNRLSKASSLPLIIEALRK